MNSVSLPEDSSKQWELLLIVITAEEKKIDRTGEGEVETMNYFLNNEGVRQIFLQWLRQMKESYSKKTSKSDTALKCDNVSFHWRQRGNDKFRANHYEDSYHCYSKSIVYAPQDGPMYPLALANRAAALLKMKRFQECLSDIAMALDSGYPVMQQHKLLLRRADCHIELASRDDARAALSAATKHAAKLGLSPAHRAEFEKNIKIVEQKLEHLKEVQKKDEDVLPGCFKGENEDFNAASKAIELRRSDTAGRYVVTTEATRRGDVMFSEEPYAWVTLPSCERVCDACCRADVNVVPCNGCSRSVYCSKECRERASPSFHKWECAGARANIFPTIGIAHLALRVLLITAYNGFPRVPETEPDPNTASNLFLGYSCVDNIQIYKRDTPPFYRMFNLVTNFDKMSNMDYIQYALTATMLTLYLENYTSFFDYLPSRVPYALSGSELRLFAAAVILRSLGQLVCNGHAALSLATADEDDDKNGRTLTEREVRRATAIYPSAAMMNHSCDPNIVNTFYNSRLIVRCARELPPGGEVLNCYGPHRSREPTAQRRAQLRAQYLFTCACSACADVDRKDFVSLFTAYACRLCKGPVVWTKRRGHCQQCQAEFNPAHVSTTMDKANDLLVQANQATSAEERCKKTHAALRLRQYVFHRHHTSLRAAADKLARMYADIGEFGRSVELIKLNIQSMEYQFGSFSVEVAHELRKLSDVMMERIINSPQNSDYREWCLETHKILKKAVQLMELNYGSWEPLVKQLMEQERFVATLVEDSRSPDALVQSDCVHRNLHYNLKI